jgi:hypothetical protein
MGTARILASFVHLARSSDATLSVGSMNSVGEDIPLPRGSG